MFLLSLKNEGPVANVTPFRHLGLHSRRGDKILENRVKFRYMYGAVLKGLTSVVGRGIQILLFNTLYN